MMTLTLKISEQLGQELERASQRAKLSKSELARRALTRYMAQSGEPEPFVSALDQAGDLVGCFKGGPRDLASNPKHLADFGKA